MSTVLVNGVTKSFGRTTALDGVDLKAGPGVTGLLGPNGAGKTTLLRMIATVLAPDRGTVTLLGRDPSRPESANASATCRRRPASTAGSRSSSSSTTSRSSRR